MKRDTRLTFRFDGTARAEDVRQHDTQPLQDDIQALEQLIRHGGGSIEAAPARPSVVDKSVEVIEQREERAGDRPSVWHFPEPIHKPKQNHVETERKTEHAAKRIVAEVASIDLSPLDLVESNQSLPPMIEQTQPIVVISPPPEISQTQAIRPYDWGILEEERGRGTDKGSGGLRYVDINHTRNARGPSWLKVFASVAGAIATGALFGYMALALFAGEGPWAGGSGEKASTDNEQTTITQPASNEGQQGAQTGSNSTDNASGTTPVTGVESSTDGVESVGSADKQTDASAAVVQVGVPAQTYHALQYGVFSGTEGADAAVAELKDKGLAAYRLDTGEDYRVYMGISSDRDGALALTQQLDGLEVYVKAIELPAIDSMPFNGDAELLKQYWKQTSELITVLDRLTLDQLDQAKLAPFSTAVSAAWKKLHEQWLSTSSQVTTKLSGDQASAGASRMAQSINTAAVALGEFDKKPSAAYLWNVQTALMGAIFAEKGWLESNAGL
ncbi:sporulation related protein [Paenibacillus cellulosilyticus]|uniref:Sporulation related protein n=1 Tax=Paenibacillus cellulosilyticus TaxID=375489 RepID=A0A2V2YGE4_9BACL|nr:SPOR domain-containing protein [Paenibacillus cellulosilyticus]PWV91952.1 sporulation related protein [Paenibacillus cellulosilyticus]QKS46689.1 SPOR domain-containing protein [Paenibacillus cellulosilyticus]